MATKEKLTLEEALAELDKELDLADAEVLANWQELMRQTGVMREVLPFTITLRVYRDIADAQDNYRSGLTDIVERLTSSSSGDTRSAASNMRQLIKGMAEQVYVEGLREGGIEDAESQLSEEDTAAIQDWVAGQLPYVIDFLKAVAEEGQTGSTLNRIELWVGALGSLGHTAIMSARENMMVTWEYGDTDQHCTTCSTLHGQRHRLKWYRDKGYIPREPASETLSCGGWGCDCRLVDDDGNQVI